MSRKGIALIGLAVVVGVVLAFWLRSTQPGGFGISNGSSSSSTSSQGGTAVSSRVAVTRELSCEDRSDNEGDGLTDCDDPDCSGVAACRCGAFTCGGEGGEACRPEDGCICSQGTCMACRVKDQTCGTSADCCAGLALECQQVTLATGALEKRCMPQSRFVCNIRCQDGPGGALWGEPYGCAMATAPEQLEDCADLTETCDLAPNPERNVRRCWQS